MLLLFPTSYADLWEIPTVPTFDDFAFILHDKDGNQLCQLRHIIDFEGRTIPGATSHRLDNATFSMPNDLTVAPETAYLDLDVLQFVSITPYAMPEHSLWGIVGKPKWGYTPRGRTDLITIQLVGVEYLLHSRLLYVWDDVNGKMGVSISADTPDDAAKEIVRQCWDGLDASDISRAWNWGTLAVAADDHEVTTFIDDEGVEQSAIITSLFVGGYVDETIKALAEHYQFNYELRPSVSAGAITFTFDTGHPSNGVDRSKGNGANDEVLINDIGAMVPSAHRFRDWYGMTNANHAHGDVLVRTDTDSITSWGRWEFQSEFDNAGELDMELRNLAIKEGAEYEYNAVAAGGQCNWIEHYIAGDQVSRNNTRLDIAAATDTISAVKFSFPTRRLHLEIEWGDKEPGNQDKKTGKYRGRPKPVPDYRIPVAVGAANAEGVGTGMNRDDHVHKSVVVVGVQTVSPDTGVTTFVAGTGMALTGNSPADHQITFASSVTGGCYWDRAANGGDPYLFPRTSGDDVHVLGGGAFRLKRADSTLAYLLDNTGDVLIYGDDGTTQKIGLEAQNGSIGTVHCFTAGRLSSGDGHENVGRLNLYAGLNADADAHFFDDSIAHWYHGDEHTGIETVTISGTDGSIQTHRANGTLAVHVAATGDILGYDDDGTSQMYGLEAQYGGVFGRKWGLFGKLPASDGSETQYALQLYKGPNANAHFIVFEGGVGYWASGVDYATWRVAVSGADGSIQTKRSDGTLAFHVAASGDVLGYDDDGVTQTYGLEAQYGGVFGRKWGLFGKLPPGDGSGTQYALQLYQGSNANANLILFDSGVARWSTSATDYASYRVEIGGANGDIIGKSAAGTTVFQVDGATGDICLIKGVIYDFPAAQGDVDTILKNDGNGYLAWVDGTTYLKQHALLGSYHDDTTTATVSVGSLIYGAGSPTATWQELTLGAEGTVPMSVSGALVYTDVLTPAEHTAIGNGAPHHAAVTLAASADVLLGLSTQDLSLDAQAAHYVLVGPTTGTDVPTFRALVAADLPDKHWSDSGTQLYPATAGRDVIVRSVTPATTITLSAATGNATFAGTITVQGNLVYLGDVSTYLYRYVAGSTTSLVTDQATLAFYNATNNILFVGAVLRPTNTNTITLGAASQRFAQYYGVLGNLSGQLTVGAAGAAPFALQATATKVDYLDSDLLDGQHGSYYAPVTLAASAAVLLNLSTQELSLDTQTANYVFAGPATGAAAAPTFRTLVAADLPAAAVLWTDDTAALYPTTAGRNVLVRKADTTTTITLTAATGAAAFGGPLTATGISGSSFVRATGFVNPGAGAGAELAYSGGTAYLQGVDRGAAAYVPLVCGGTTVTLVANATTVLTVAAASVTTTKQIVSSLAVGTAPISVTSTTECPNLNAYLLNGHSSATAATGNTICLRGAAGEGTFAALGATTGTFSSAVSATQYTSTIATGTSPLVVASTTECPNLNAYLLNGHASATAATGNTICLRDASGNGTFAALGATTGTFSSTVSATQYTSTVATGTAPLVVSSTTQVNNLNAALLNGNASATAATGNTICLRNASGDGTFAALGATTGTFSSTVSATQYTSTVATGTAPLVVASTTQVGNLNANYLNGYYSDSAAANNTIALRGAAGQLSMVAANISGNLAHSGSNIGFFGTAPAAKDAVADLGARSAITGSDHVSAANVDDNFKVLYEKQNELLDALQSYGLV